MRYLLLCFALACASTPVLEVPPPVEASCTFWVCRGCVRRAELDFACHGHEFLTQAYDCPVEFDLCKANQYGGWCCFPAPGQE